MVIYQKLLPQTKKRGVFYLSLKICLLNRLASYDEYPPELPYKRATHTHTPTHTHTQHINIHCYKRATHTHTPTRNTTHKHTVTRVPHTCTHINTHTHTRVCSSL